MGFTVEIAFDLLNTQGAESMRREAITRAEGIGCDEVFWNYELEGGRTVERNHCVITATFSRIDRMARFVRFAKTRRGYAVESVVDVTSCPLLVFASKSYAHGMSREKRDEYQERKKQRNWTEEQRLVLRAVTGRKA